MGSNDLLEKPRVDVPPTWPPDDGDEGGGGGNGGDDDSGAPGEPHESGPPVSVGRLATYIVLASVTMLFAGCLSAYIILRSAAPVWPPPGAPVVPRSLWASTAAIIISSLFGWGALRAIRAGDQVRLTGRLALTLLFGLGFCALQGWLWRGLVRQQPRAALDHFAANFYLLTVLHVLHVVGGILYLFAALMRARAGRLTLDSHDFLTNAMLYWHFVGGIWYVLFVVLYFL